MNYLLDDIATSAGFESVEDLSERHSPPPQDMRYPCAWIEIRTTGEPFPDLDFNGAVAVVTIPVSAELLDGHIETVILIDLLKSSVRTAIMELMAESAEARLKGSGSVQPVGILSRVEMGREG